MTTSAPVKKTIYIPIKKEEPVEPLPDWWPKEEPIPDKELEPAKVS